jgi:hypothetical protein
MGRAKLSQSGDVGMGEMDSLVHYFGVRQDMIFGKNNKIRKR